MGVLLTFGFFAVMVLVGSRILEDQNPGEGGWRDLAFLFLPNFPFALALLWRAAPLRPLRRHRPSRRRLVMALLISLFTAVLVTGLVMAIGALVMDSFFKESSMTIQEAFVDAMRQLIAPDSFSWETTASALVIIAFCTIPGLIWACTRGAVRSTWDAPGRTMKWAALAATAAAAWLAFSHYLGDVLLNDWVQVLSVTFLPLLVLAAGGAFTIWHSLARVAMAVRRRGPVAYHVFLRVAVHRLLLREAGGTYQFTHRLLLEHLARSASHR
jgi:hypothetical protein